MKHSAARRLLAVLLSVLLFFVLCCTAFAAPDSSEAHDTAQALIRNAQDYLTKTPPGSWSLLLARQLSATPSEAAIESITGSVKISAGSYSSLDALTYDILSLTALGYPADDYEGLNLIGVLANFPITEDMDTTSLSMALLALDSAAYPTEDSAPNNRRSLCELLLARELPSGGFSGADGEFDADATAYALMALAGGSGAAYASDTVIERAFSALASAQQPDGSFLSDGSASSSAISHVISALRAHGRSSLDSAFVKQGTLLTALGAFQNEDGGFSASGGLESSMTATEQAILALYTITEDADSTSPFVCAKTPDALKILKTQKDFTRSFFGMLLIACACIYGCLVLTTLIGRRFKK